MNDNMDQDVRLVWSAMEKVRSNADCECLTCLAEAIVETLREAGILPWR